MPYSVRSFRLSAFAVVVLAGVCVVAPAWADPASDEANRQNMMADMRASAAANDRANFDSQQRQQADSGRYSGSGGNSASGSGDTGSSAASGGTGSGSYRSDGPRSIVATYSFTIHRQESPAALATRLEAEATAGHALSAFNLGRILYTGFDGIPRNDASARRWFGQAAKLGHPGGQSQYGYMLHDGLGGPVDRAAALDWVKKAAAQGDSYGEALFGFYSIMAITDDTQAPEAIGYLKSAADKGAPGSLLAQATLGTVVYALGVGAPADKAESARYSALAAAQGDAGSQVQLARLLLTGHGVAEDDAAAVVWLRKAADHNNGAAMALLGQLAFTGKGMAQDNAAGAMWFKRAADAGDAAAAGQWAQLLLGGEYGVAKDEVAGARYARISADKGDTNGQMTLARCYYNGNGVAVDMQQALFWFRKAAVQGDAGGQRALSDPRMIEAARGQ